MNWKRLLATGMLCVLLVTDQGVAYAAENYRESVTQKETDAGLTEDGTETQEEESPEEEEKPSEEEKLPGESPGEGEPEEEEKPSEEEKPEEGEPEEGEKPSEEEKPEEGEPEEWEKPSEGEQPEEGEKPSEGEKPEESEPEEGEKPSEEEKPEEGEPEEGEKPPEEEKPGEGEPEEGEKPSEGEQPEGGEKPSEGEKPEEGEPEEGEKPSEEEEPGDGNPEGEQTPDTPEGQEPITEEEVSDPQDPTADQPVSVSEVTISEIPEQFYTGKEICPELVLTDSKGTVLQKGTHYTAEYSSHINVGQASVKITGIEKNGYTGTAEKKFVISPFSIDSEEIVFSGLEEEYPYTGKPVVPAVTLVRKDTVLREGTDYKITCSDNKETGTARLTAEGTGNYTGTVTKTFKIGKRSISSDKTKISFKDKKSSYTYNGKARKPKVTVKYDGKTLKENEDYKVSYSDNKNAGTAKVEITGKGAYSGTATKKFTIKPLSVSKLKITKFGSYSYLNIGKLNTKVKYGSTTLKKGKDYTITFKNKVKTGNNKVVIKGKGNFTGSRTMTVKVTFSDKDKVSIQSCAAASWDAGKKELTVKIKTGSASKLKKAKTDFYIVQMNSLGKTSRKRVKASFDGNSLKAVFKAKDGGKVAMMSKYAVAVKIGSDYKIITKSPEYISNPKITATMTEPYNGYYEEGGKVTSKKGIQGASKDYLEDLGAQHVLLNMDIADIVSTKKKSGFVSYKYNGKTYYFLDMIAWVQTLRHLNGWDNDNPYGWHRRSVTVVLLLSWKSGLSYLIHPSARKEGAAPYYAFNMKEKKARETFEALFCYLGEKLGDNKKSRVCNWTLGNEVNACNAWNYSGGMSLDECVENYADAFQLLYQGVKRTASTSRVFISLDHSWNASTDGHSGKKYLDKFASYMNKTAPKTEWNVNYHPYSQPLTRSDFWNDGSNTKNSVNTSYISMKNISVLTNYLSKIEAKYKKKKNSIRVILGEQGFSGVRGKTGEEKKQAAALGYGYYIAAFNSRIDAYIIRTYLDDPEEKKGGLYLGLMDSSHKKKQAYDVYKYVDTVQSTDYMKKYLSTVGISSWKKKIPNFNADKLNAGDF